MFALTNFKNNSGFFIDKEWKYFIIKYLIIYSVLITFVAIFSFDYYYPDEHFQTIEFSSYKMGITKIEHMPWEYQAKMRPWLQSSIYYSISNVLFFLNIKDRFFHAFVYRMFGALLGLAALFLIMLTSYGYNKDKRKAIVIMLVFLWVIPWLIVRTSSEAYSGIFSAIGIAYMCLCSNQVTGYKRLYSPSVMFITGILLGLTFQFRYQAAFLIVGVLLWIAFISSINKRERINNLVFMLLGIFVTLVIGLAIDWWGYGSFTIAPWNYFRENIINKASENFGTSPFWDYIQSIPNIMSDTTDLQLFRILPYFAIISVFVFWIRYPKHILTWATLAFVFLHAITPHKEARFMFPLAFFLPTIIALAFSAKGNEAKDSFFNKLWGLRKKWYLKIFYAINLIGIVFMICAASTYSNPNYFFRYFYYNHKSDDITIYSTDTWPVELGGNIVEDFYYRKNIQFINADYEAFKNVWRNSNEPVYFKASSFNLPFDEMRPYVKVDFAYVNRKYIKNLWFRSINGFLHFNLLKLNDEPQYELVVFKVNPPR
jgi:GPI mannosyltransferase 3